MEEMNALRGHALCPASKKRIQNSFIFEEGTRKAPRIIERLRNLGITASYIV